ncbi:ferredoxin [Nocardia vinacea]|uniref:ferredoxin n=1 Tax=Nocardia vinacea TaxID=96468 RepID=UPI00031D3658|nr:ferredoxin [Nocardia vinacea]
MKLVVDRNRCIGAGMCALTAPALFDQDDDDGLVITHAETPTPDQEGVVREAVEACPSGALRTEE